MGWKAIFLLFLILSHKAWGQPFPDDHSIIDRESREINLNNLAKVHLLTEQYRFNLANYIPLRGLPERDNGSEIGRRILKQTVQTVFDKYEESPNSFVRQTGQVNSNMKANIRFSTQRVGFRVRVFEAVAEVSFSGYINGKFAYEIDQEEAKGEISKHLFGRTFIYSHVRGSDQTTDMLIVRWSF